MSDWDFDDYSYDQFTGDMVYDPKPKKYKKSFPTKVTPKFRVGDRVRLKSGTAEIEITKIHFQCSAASYQYIVTLDGKYVNSDNVITQRNQDDFVKYDGESKMTTNTNKLYTWVKHDDTTFAPTDLYGHYLATNSQGEWVMEVKGSGQIMAVAKDKVQEVLPYTIGVRFNNNGTTYHYLADKDKFTEGFYLVKDTSSSGWQIARVVDVDTKSSKATVEFNPLGKLAVDLY